MLIAALILTGLAALLHVYIFVLESVMWTTPRARAVFGLTEDEAVATKSLAFNQGFYNLFLAIAVLLGIVLLSTGAFAVGATLIFVGAGSMVAAAIVLVLSNPASAGSALKQGLLPALGVVALLIALAV